MNKIKKILVSQPAPTSNKSPYHDLAEKTNVKIDFRPFIKVESISPKDFRKQKVNILNHSAAIFTSKTSIDHFFEMAKALRISIPDSMKYFCISEAAAFYLQKYIVYRKRKIFYGKRTFDDLVSAILKHKNEKFLLPLSEVHKKEIPEKLTKLNINYSKAILYKTVSCNLSDLSCEEYDILVFFSPLGIKSLFSNFPDFAQNGTRIASFGKATARAVKEAGLRLDIEAPKINAPSMSMALEMYIKKYNTKDTRKKL